MIKMGSFRSYVGLEEYEMKVPRPTNGSILKPEFLEGELEIAEAHNVLKFTSISNKKGLSGSLFVTNARLIFVSSENKEKSIPLLSINTIYYYEDTKSSSSGGTNKMTRRKVKLGINTLGVDSPNPSLQPASIFCSSSTRVNELVVICSNFQTLRVSFKFSLVDHGQKVTNALIHWSFPSQPEKLFYLDYSRALEFNFNSLQTQPRLSVPLYDIPGDWLREMKITRSTGFRISTINMHYYVTESLPETIVVPSDFKDDRLKELAEKLRGARPPFWTFGNMNGAAILRMSKLHDEAESMLENQFFETLRKSHPQKRQPYIFDLDPIFSAKELKVSMLRLIELCCPESLSHYEEMDSKFYSHLENTKWLSFVSRALQIAGEVAETFSSSSDVVILQENESRDTSCLISSLAQLILEARFRTLSGFFSLIQKDWICTGHAFHTNYMHTSPIFLLFLDCTFQLMHQNPFEFEFNEMLIAEIWDTCFDSTSGSFMFDSPSQRKSLEKRSDLTVWNRILLRKREKREEEKSKSPNRESYKSSLSSSMIPTTHIPKILLNPLYKLKPILAPPSVQSTKNNTVPILNCYPFLPSIKLWDSLYLLRTAEPIDHSLTQKTKIGSPHFATTSFIKHTGSPQKPKPEQVLKLSSASPKNKPVSAETTAFPFPHETEPNKSAESGRNFDSEFNLVEKLLAAVSSSGSSSKPFKSSSKAGPGPHSISATKRIVIVKNNPPIGVSALQHPSSPDASLLGISGRYSRHSEGSRSNPFADKL